MAEQNGRKNNFIMQAGILAAAGIVSRMIGLLYKSPLMSVIGETGMGYYSEAYSYYTIILLISSYSIPGAISKAIAQKLGVKEYRNAHRFFLCAIGYVLTVGAAASLFLYFGAGFFVVPEAIPVLQVFAPTVFVYGLLGVLRGYFQAHRSMAQTSLSQILEQIAHVIVSLVLARTLIQANLGSLEVPEDAAGRVDRAVSGAMGSALGTGAGVLVALLFMAAVYALNYNFIHRRIERDRHKRVDSYQDILKTIVAVVTPFILSTAVYNLNVSLNSWVYTKVLPVFREVEGEALHSGYGVFNGMSVTISNIPIAFSSAMAAAMLPYVSQLLSRKDFDAARDKIGLAVKATMIISIPSAVGLLVLAKPVTYLLFPSRGEEVIDMAARLLMTLAFSVVLYALSTLNNTILQGLGKVNAPILNAVAALLVQTAVAVPLLLFTELGIYSLAIASTVFAGSMCILNQRSVRKAIGYRQEMSKTFLKPALSSTFMGMMTWAVYEGGLMLFKSPRIAVFPAVIVGVIVYFALLLLFKGVSEQELRGFPKGHLLVKLAKRCRLL